MVVDRKGFAPPGPRMLLGWPGSGTLADEEVGLLRQLRPGTPSDLVVRVQVSVKYPLKPYNGQRGNHSFILSMMFAHIPITNRFILQAKVFGVPSTSGTSRRR